jgi:serine/threonine-protein kinase
VIPLPQRVDGDVRERLRELGEIFVAFDDDESGCLVTALRTESGEWCVKHAVNDRGAAAQARGLAVHAAVRHAALVAPIQVVEGVAGPIVVSPWVQGERLRHNPMVKHLPIATRLEILDVAIEVHALVNGAGFVSIDFYDGNLLYDGKVHVIDVDEYRPAPFVLDAERTLGSTRFMAPEEFVRGATLDARTTVFQLGRAAMVLLDDIPQSLASVVERATHPDPGARFADAAELLRAWRDRLRA